MAGKTGKGTVGTADLAAALGISRQRVNELGRAGKIQRESDGKWNADKVRQSLGRNMDSRQVVKAAGGEKVQESAGTEPPRGTLLYEQWRLTREKADREALDRKVLEGSLLNTDEVRRAISAMISASKSRLTTMPDELCDRLAAETNAVVIREMISVKVREVLEQLSEWPAA